MFGKRSGTNVSASRRVAAPQPLPAVQAKELPKAQSGRGQLPDSTPRPEAPAARSPEPPKPKHVERRHSEEYYDIKTTVFNALIDTIDLTQLAKLDADAAREEIRDIVGEIVQVKNVVMSIAEQ
jgi:pilus assembly protein CpaF